jgi:hypothetical protein
MLQKYKHMTSDLACPHRRRMRHNLVHGLEQNSMPGLRRSAERAGLKQPFILIAVLANIRCHCDLHCPLLGEASVPLVITWPTSALVSKIILAFCFQKHPFLLRILCGNAVNAVDSTVFQQGYFVMEGGLVARWGGGGRWEGPTLQ